MHGTKYDHNVSSSCSRYFQVGVAFSLVLVQPCSAAGLSARHPRQTEGFLDSLFAVGIQDISSNLGRPSRTLFTS